MMADMLDPGLPLGKWAPFRPPVELEPMDGWTASTTAAQVTSQYELVLMGSWSYSGKLSEGTPMAKVPKLPDIPEGFLKDGPSRFLCAVEGLSSMCLLTVGPDSTIFASPMGDVPDSPTVLSEGASVSLAPNLYGG